MSVDSLRLLSDPNSALPLLARGSRGLLRALAVAALAAGCSVSELNTIPCNDNSNCPGAAPTCSVASGKCVASAPASKLEIVAGGTAATATVTSALPAAFKVRVSDTAGNPVTGTPVTWAVVSGEGNFAGQPTATTLTGPDGTASVTATLGKVAGPNVFSASAAGLTGSPAAFTATGAPAAAATFSVAFPLSLVARTAASARVAAFDRFGNPASYAGAVNVSVGVPDPLATLPQAVPLSLAVGATGTIDGISLVQATVGQSIIVTDARTPSITGAQTGIAVAAHASATSLASSLNPSLYGQGVTFTATVSSDAGTPAGTVTFLDGGAPLGTGTLAGGVATLGTSALLGGSHSITAVYAGDASFAASTSAAVSQVVNKAVTTAAVALTAGSNPSIFGAALTFTATVSSSAGVPTGVVVFRDGPSALGAPVPLSGGVATFTTAALAGGAHTLRVDYSGDNNFAVSTSPPLPQTVNPAATGVALGSSLNPSTYAQPVTFTATVSPVVSNTSGAPTGTVTFKDGSAQLGAPVALVNGVASLTTATLSGGTHAIRAVYGGDTNFSSASGTLSQVVNAAATATSLARTSGTDPSSFNQPLKFTATVSSASAGTIGGTVAFQDSGVVLAACAALPVVSGAATCTVSSLVGGTHSIKATFSSGDTNFSGSVSQPISQTVNQANDSVAVVSSVNPSVFGQAVTFTATVTTGAGTPTGTIAFRDNGVDIASCASVAVSSGAASCTFSALTTAGSPHPISAVYSGDSNFQAATSSPLAQTVNKADSTATLSGSGSPTVFGQGVTLTATVAAAAPGAGAPTGSVTFSDNGTVIAGCGAQPITSGVATCSTASLAVATHPITAVYNGDGSFNASPASNTVNQSVTQAATTVSLAGSGSPTVSGQPVTLTATIAVTAPGAGAPSGNVTFLDNDVAIGSCAAQPVSAGQATCTVPLTAATHPLTAVYNGDLSFSASPASNTVSQVVGQAATAVALVSSVNPSVSGQAVVFTATVSATAPGAGSPTGNITFQDAGVTINSCGSRTITARVATCTVASLAAASSPHAITATYNGDNNFAGSTSSPVSQAVNRAATTVALASSVNPSTFGQAVTFTATITVTGPGAGSPSGTVNFQDNGVDLAGCSTRAVSGSVATCSLSSLSVKSHPITATYSGDGSFLASPVSNTLSQVVSQAATTVALASSVNPSTFGQAVTFTATITVTGPGAGSPSGTVKFQDNGVNLGGCTAQAVTGGAATCTLSSLGIGGSPHPITATYSGDASFSASAASTPVSQVVQPASTTIALASSGPSVSGQAVTFTATISVTAPGAGSPTGSVNFQADGADIGGCAAQTVTASTATCSVSSLSVATHAITATYNGDTNFNASAQSSPVSQVVSKAATTVSVASSGPATFGQTVTFTATVSVTAPGGGSPTGSVAFRDNGTNIAGCGSQPVASGQATCSTTLSTTTHPITAIYGGDTGYTASPASSPLNQVVGRAATTTTLSFLQAQPGTPFTLTGTVAASTASGSPTGTLTFKSDGVTIAGPNSDSQPVALTAIPGNTKSSAAFRSSAPDVSTGSHTFTAAYSGDVNYLPSTSSGNSFTVSVIQRGGGGTATSVIGGAGAGKVLIASGATPGVAAASRATFIFDPTTSSMTAGPLLAAPRAFHTATAIGGGRILFAGGASAGGPAYEICTLDGTPACVPSGGPSAVLRCNAAAALVTRAPARVLVAGGDDCAGGPAHTSWELWDGESPATEAAPIVSSGANGLTQGRQLLTATALGEGRVLLAGGGSATAELFTLGASVTDSAVRPVGPMLAARTAHTATLLAPGTAACPAGACVLLAGGVLDPAASTWEIFSTATGGFGRPARAQELVTGLRSRHAATLLSDGRVLLAGGTADGQTGLASTETFDPAQLRFAPGLALQSGRVGAASTYLPAQDLLLLSGGGGARAPELITAP